MTESRFVNQNREQWEEFHSMILKWDSYSPSELGNAYLSICSDLSFAQTHFPDTSVCSYLNSLALQYHHILYRRQPQRWKELARFFTHDVPLAFYNSRNYLLFSVGLFVLGCVMGVLSQIIDNDFFRDFLGWDYYAETMKNIKEGNPMGIYQDPDAWDMYVRIALNNIMVGLNAFKNGLLTPLYVIYMEIMNGVMIGCFDAFFFQQGCGVDALIAPNEHGALELPAIIVSCAAGLQLGFGWFFPGKRSRMSALIYTAKNALILALAMVPVFAFAAVIESFITRYQDWPIILRIGIVLAGLAFVLYYMVILPQSIHDKDIAKGRKEEKAA